jgi:hypothetical protein
MLRLWFFPVIGVACLGLACWFYVVDEGTDDHVTLALLALAGALMRGAERAFFQTRALRASRRSGEYPTP